ISTGAAWLCAIGYAYQLYFDFSGYSTMAVGLGDLFGLRLPQNFNSPYKAADISNFWERWHSSLSTVLPDYVYNTIAFWIKRRGGEGGGRKKRMAESGGVAGRVREHGRGSHDAHDAAGRIVARRELDVRVLGRVSRTSADGVSILEEVVRPVAESAPASDYVRA